MATSTGLESALPMDGIAVNIKKRSSATDRYAADAEASDIHVVSPKEYKEAALCLAEAFCEDEVVRYPIDTPDRMDWTDDERFELHKQALEYITYAHCLRGLVTTTGVDYGCVALWMPPGKNMDGWMTILRSGMWRLAYKLSAEGKKRFFDEFLPLLHQTKLEVMGERDNNSWYLVYIGTKRASRGKGYAKKLIKQVTDKLDEEGRACYLESSNEVNLKIYGKLGFQLKKKIYLVRAEKQLCLDIMVREPALKPGGELN